MHDLFNLLITHVFLLQKNLLVLLIEVHWWLLGCVSSINLLKLVIAIDRRLKELLARFMINKAILIFNFSLLLKQIVMNLSLSGKSIKDLCLSRLFLEIGLSCVCRNCSNSWLDAIHCNLFCDFMFFFATILLSQFDLWLYLFHSLYAYLAILCDQLRLKCTLLVDAFWVDVLLAQVTVFRIVVESLKLALGSIEILKTLRRQRHINIVYDKLILTNFFFRELINVVIVVAHGHLCLVSWHSHCGLIHWLVINDRLVHCTNTCVALVVVNVWLLLKLHCHRLGRILPPLLSQTLASLIDLGLEVQALRFLSLLLSILHDSLLLDKVTIAH